MKVFLVLSNLFNASPSIEDYESHLISLVLADDGDGHGRGRHVDV